MRKEQIYILGQDNTATLCKLRFVSEGFAVSVFSSLGELLARMEKDRPDLVFNCEYRGSDGVEFCLRVREKTNALIILMGKNLSDMDVIGALRLGADICLPDNISTSLLLAQVHACFRRDRLTLQNSEKEKERATGYLIDTPQLKIDTGSRSVILNYAPVPLTAREFDILALLAAHPNQVFYTKQIFHSVWDADSILSGDDRPVYVHISNLRKKIEPDPLNPTFIITLRGVGYKFQPPG
ncbi:MAG: response regulator transcription factor [Desulfovibrio sp.]|jgi:DNA-binding response OmpR family regulator|nr:response regulator transcription factor [Desulfovibrio sp.]